MLVIYLQKLQNKNKDTQRTRILKYYIDYRIKS